ncbi:MAG: UPF0262 family protein [Alphaproteobacteria bacterium]|nr:UPF0262 family protein [Alphaproteobacteria bacterium]
MAAPPSDTAPPDAEDGGSAVPARLISVVLDEETVPRRSPEIEHERRVAIFDLLDNNLFRPLGVPDGPYALYLRLADGRLVFDIRDADDAPLRSIILALTPFRRIIREYFQVCESYFAAIKTAPPSRIEALDMGRRALHIEGSGLLRARLDGKVELDDITARRLFTLICVLHARG